MDILQLIEQTINNLGFPIAMVVYFIWDKNKTLQPVVDAVNNNSKILEKLLVKIDAEELLQNEE